MKRLHIPILTAVALVVSLIESMIPLPIVMPGAKLGLSNIVILTCLIVFGFRDSLVIGILKSFLLMLITGAVISFFYSLAGAVSSLVVMYLVNKYLRKYFSLIGVSLFGAFTHNLSQVLVCTIMLNNLRILVYLPILVFLSIFTGVFVGLTSNYLSNALSKQKNYLFNNRR